MEAPQYHILYIEDHDDTRELIAYALANAHYRVTAGSTVADALKLACEQPFDLYLLDSRLPDGSGIDLCKRLQELAPLTPILVLSGAACTADKLSAITSGAHSYLTKPVELPLLCSEIGKLIEKSSNREDFPETGAISCSTLEASLVD